MRRALAFLTPFGGARTPSAATLDWFPAAGLLLGVVLGLTWNLAARVWPATVSAALVVTADLAITGLLHLDGLVDAADGLVPHLSRERRLEVMAEPGAGAFGVGAAVAVLLLRWAALAAMSANVLLLAALWCASRTSMAGIARSLPYVREEGLATAFIGGRGPGAALLGGAVALAVAVLARGGVGALAVAGVAIGAGGVSTLARRRIGGFTGDVLGAAGLVGETVGLLVAAARW